MNKNLLKKSNILGAKLPDFVQNSLIVYKKQMNKILHKTLNKYRYKMFNPDLFAKLESGEGYNKTRESSVLNPFVNFHNYKDTQSLQDVLVSESIQMRGVECFYIRREYVNLDLIFGEDNQSRFEKAYKTAMYIQSFDGYEGQRDFFSKFGMQVNDEVSLQTNPSLFKHQTDGNLPLEGDLIYFPMGNALFEVVWVEPFNPFYQTGVNSTLTITASKFVYSGEELAPKVKVRPEPPEVNPCDDFGLDLDELTSFEETPELAPVANLNGLVDIKKAQFAEDRQIWLEGGEFIDPDNFDPVNGAGENPTMFPPIPNSPFDDF